MQTQTVFEKLNAQKRGLIEIFSPSKISRVAFVFVHGFRANSANTWEPSSWLSKYRKTATSFWPADLGRQYDAAVLAFNYPNDWFGRSPLASMELDIVAQELSERLYTLSHAYDEMVFFTHSFGGLLFKSLLVRLACSDPGPRSMLQKIRGLCAFSCPNNGSPWALISRVPMIAAPNFKNLRWNSPRLQKLDRDFSVAVRQHANKRFRILSYAEYGYVAGAFRVEPETCKFQHLSDISTDIDSPCNHTAICKAVLTDPDRANPLHGYIRRLSLGKYIEAPLGPI
jgi:pimeloyl-ACP methyl ester carboxylesterase